MNQYKIYLATEVEVTAEDTKSAFDKALGSFMVGIMKANDDFSLKISDVTLAYIPEGYIPKKKARNGRLWRKKNERLS